MPGGLPICVYDTSVGNGGMFRVVYSKGKALSNGGYGVTAWAKQLNHEEKIEATSNPKTSDDSPKMKPFEFLFIEEAVFLHECGLLVVHRTSGNDEHLDVSSQTPMDTQELYALMLNEMNFPLSVYLTYSHLRSQMYRVMRHSKNRLTVLRKMIDADDIRKKKRKNGRQNDQHTNSENTMSPKEEGEKGKPISNDVVPKEKNKKTFNQVKHVLRKDVLKAPIPHVLYPCKETRPKHNDESSDDLISKIAFDVWNPDSSFRKTNPGLPDFVCAITCFAEHSIQYSQIKALIQSCESIPLRLATVADSGTVIMFGLTDYGVPSITRTKEEKE